VGALSLEQISKRLKDSLKLLTAGGRTAAPRQRTLRGTLDWSHQLLGEPERELFGRLSVFAGGWTLEAAEAVASGGGVEEGEVLDLLLGLVDKSLVTVEAEAGDAPRYGMLEPVRQYARERLEHAGKTEDFLSRHAAYFLKLAEEAEPELEGGRQEVWLERLEWEHDNLRAALSGSLDRGSETAVRLAGSLYRFWWMRGHFEVGWRWLERALSTTSGPLAARAKALRGAGSLAASRGESERATLLYGESLSMSRELGDKDATSRTLVNLGSLLRERGQTDRARQAFEESRVLSRELNDEQGVAFALQGLGDTAYLQGDYESAKDLYEKSLALHRKFEDRHSVAIVLDSLGEVANIRGEHERAAVLAQESLVLFRELGGKLGMAQTLLTLVNTSFKQGDHRRATALIRDSLSISQELGNGVLAAEGLDILGKLAVTRGEPAQAARLFGAANHLRETVDAALTPYTRSELERYVSAARERLDRAAWEAAWEEGRAAPVESVVGHVLTQEEPDTSKSPGPEHPTVAAQPAVLSRREREVAALVAQGHSNRRIAQELYLSERTIENHVSKILRKLERTSRTEIATWATGQRHTAPEPQ
jgi:DNA-binding CsgD family transcriptional regulator/tetratricopeptide (TPR) repeat protein